MSVYERNVSEMSRLNAQLQNVVNEMQVPRALLKLIIDLKKGKIYLNTTKRVDFGLENPREWGIASDKGTQK
jgi:hypothetical protein